MPNIKLPATVIIPLQNPAKHPSQNLSNPPAAENSANGYKKIGPTSPLLE